MGNILLMGGAGNMGMPLVKSLSKVGTVCLLFAGIAEGRFIVAQSRVSHGLNLKRCD